MSIKAGDYAVHDGMECYVMLIRGDYTLIAPGIFHNAGEDEDCLLSCQAVRTDELRVSNRTIEPAPRNLNADLIEFFENIKNDWECRDAGSIGEVYSGEISEELIDKFIERLRE